jgi:hypothetical protein
MVIGDRHIPPAYCGGRALWNTTIRVIQRFLFQTLPIHCSETPLVA